MFAVFFVDVCVVSFGLKYVRLEPTNQIKQ